MVSTAGTTVSVILMLVQFAQSLLLIVAVCFAEIRCHTNTDLKHLTYPTEVALRRAPIAASMLFHLLILVLELNTVLGGNACPGLLMALALPCTVWSAALLIELYRFHYNARATGLSTTLRILREEPIIDLTSFSTVGGINGTGDADGDEDDDGDIEVVRAAPEFVWELFRDVPSEYDGAGDKVYQCYSLLAVWHFLVFMVAGSQNYRVRQKVGECTINDVEVKLFFQISLLLFVVGVFSVRRARQLRGTDPEFVAFRRVAKGVCYISALGAVVIAIPGSLVAQSFLWVLFLFTVAWDVVALASLSPLLPELERWVAGWVAWIKLRWVFRKRDKDKHAHATHEYPRKHVRELVHDPVFISFEPETDGGKT